MSERAKRAIDAIWAGDGYGNNLIRSEAERAVAAEFADLEERAAKHADFVSYPEDWPPHYNGAVNPCDMLIGPCQCGAFHSLEELVIQRSELDAQKETASNNARHYSDEAVCLEAENARLKEDVAEVRGAHENQMANAYQMMCDVQWCLTNLKRPLTISRNFAQEEEYDGVKLRSTGTGAGGAGPAYQRYAELEAENARLREALTQAAVYVSGYDTEYANEIVEALK